MLGLDDFTEYILSDIALDFVFCAVASRSAAVNPSHAKYKSQVSNKNSYSMGVGGGAPEPSTGTTKHGSFLE